MAASKRFEIVLLPGDGAGPELAKEVRRVLDKIQAIRQNIAFTITEKPFGGSAIALSGEALSESTLETCRRADAVILCGCGDIKYGLEPEKALLRLRSELGVYVNFRPIKFSSTQLYHQSPFKLSAIEGTDITFVRDLIGGVYYGKRQEADTTNAIAYDTTSYSREAIQRIARWAGSYATQSSPPKAVHSVDKYNVMATSRLWRSTVSDIFEKEFPNVPLNHLLVDHAAMLLSSAPTQLNGIILTENLFGDILSDQAGAIVGSQDVLASAGLANPTRQHVAGRPGIFEPVNLKTGASAGLGKVNPLGVIQTIIIMLDTAFGLVVEAESLESAIRKTLDPRELIGSDSRTADIGGSSSTAEFTDRLLENFDFFLEAQNSAELAAITSFMQVPLPNGTLANTGRRPMGIVEKILTHSGIGLSKDEVKPGDIICIGVDWTITNELLWAGMEKTYNQMKRPRLHRNDRFWLALDHIVDPRTNHLPKQKALIAKAELLQKEAKVIDFLPVNTSIMHTDFTRERAQPEHIIVGSDSHTCSAGSMGAFAVGMGAADVVMPMVTGETWIRVPEICKIHFVGKLPFGMGGKEVILYILGAMKRNTIAFQRAVEFTGPGLAELSMDARFAIANMTAEFGGVGACFEADGITAGWISKRKSRQHKSRGIYFKPDPDAVYAETRLIDLSKVRSTIALYPNPDNVVPLAENLNDKGDNVDSKEDD
ncbi:hypothetical protein VE03_10717 [Pseudogymnoascus sp. 23342-1-I1]|nr:hypothetical protein VE03_10717 [Pseudogymnoascus sp. 23342-1-I1]